MSASVFDVIVVGVGAMGSAASFELARRGRRVLALEQFGIPNDQGSSHGQTRIIRRAYFENPNYVPLVSRSFERWFELEQQTGVPLLVRSPCANIGPTTSELVQGVCKAASLHQLPIESLSAKELCHRYPAFRLPGNFLAIVEQDAGILFVEKCIQAHVDLAVQAGAIVRQHEPVLAWHADTRQVSVQTSTGTYYAASLVLTAGPWSRPLLARYGVNLTVMRQVPQWFATRDDRLFRRDRFPVYIVDTSLGYYYGFPVLNPLGAKVAQHYGSTELVGPEEIQRDVIAEDEENVRGFLRDFLPAIDGPRQHTNICLYTLTPDRHFIIDRHPEHDNIAIATGFSGHGFKFAPVVGEALADLIEFGKTELPIDMFKIDRFTNLLDH